MRTGELMASGSDCIIIGLNVVCANCCCGCCGCLDMDGLGVVRPPPVNEGERMTLDGSLKDWRYAGWFWMTLTSGGPICLSTECMRAMLGAAAPG